MYPLTIKSKILNKIGDLPTLPTVVTKIIQMTENPTTSSEEIARVISHDPSLTIKILKIVNSAFFGFPKKINTISHAIMILGFQDVKNIALSVSVFDVFKNDNAELRKEFDRQEFWIHSIGVGVCSKLLAKKMRLRNLEEAFIAGLLHDVGKIIFDQFFHTEFEEIMKLITRDNILFINAERMLLDIDHSEVGAKLARLWKLPDELVECIRYHHDPITRKNGNIMISIVHAADIFVRIQKIGSGWDSLIPQLKKEAWQKLKLKPEDIDKIYKELHEEAKKAEIFLEFTKN